MAPSIYGCGLLLLLLLTPPPLLEAQEEPREPTGYRETLRVVRSIDTRRMSRHLFVLADDGMEGREAGTAGGHRAALYIENEYLRQGMDPGGTNGFFQPWGATQPGSRIEFDRVRIPTSRRGRDSEFRPDEGFRTAVCSGTGMVEAEVVFVGYGITAPEYDYDDYAGIEVEGQIVVALDHEPQENDPESVFDGTKPTRYSDIAYKATNAAAHGALALVVIRDRGAHPDAAGIPADDELGVPTSSGGSSIPVVYLGDEATRALARAGSKNFERLESTIERSLQNVSTRLLNRPASVRVVRDPAGVGNKNIIALKRGVDPELADEYIVISAHYDHVGRGNQRNSRGGIGEIHNGADDNASGTCALLELAVALQTVHLRRSVLLISFDAEEKGLLGSEHFVGSPTVPLDQIVAILNIDMISRNKPAEMFIGGMGRNEALDQIVRTVCGRHRLNLNPEGMDRYIQRSDQWPFMERGIPGLFFFGGEHEDYHAASDDPEKCSLAKMKLFTQTCLVMLWELANADRSVRDR